VFALARQRAPTIRGTARALTGHHASDSSDAGERSTRRNQSEHVRNKEHEMPRLLRFQSHVVVADPRPRDYRNLTLLAGDFGWHVHLLTTGAAALQFARRNVVDLWLINCRLGDMSGFDLVEMLRDLSIRAPVFLVGDRYDADEERQACAGGVDLYLCKDAEQALDCQVMLAAAANRGPPQTEPARAGRRAVG
jgi:CheY-like chemotaxis protein